MRAPTLNAPNIRAAGRPKLRVLGTEITFLETLRRRAEADLGIDVAFEMLDFMSAQRKAATEAAPISSGFLHTRHLLEFGKDAGMVLCEMPDDTRVSEQMIHVTYGLDQVELVCAIGFLDQLELSFEILRLALHHHDLFRGQSAPPRPSPLH
jgi:hypothetical protein